MAMEPRQRTMLIVLGVVVVGAAAFFMLTRGGGGEEEAGPTVTVPPVIPSPTGAPTEEPPRFTFFAGRDPFEPIFADPSASPTPPVSPVPTDVSPAPPDEEGDQQEGSSVGGHEVVLIDVFTDGGETLVQVRVDGQTYTVAVGETFADNFQLVSVRGGCATFLFGDQSFTLCEPGERK
jgi:hypothetical protein